MKRLRILVEGSKRPPVRLKIRPSTTTRDVLAHLKLSEDYALYTLDGTYTQFTGEMELYEHVKQDEKLIADLTPQAREEAVRALRKRIEEADAFMEQIAFGEGPIT